MRLVQKGYTEAPAVPWAPSREFDLMGTRVGVGVRVLLEEEHFEWEITPLALYRADEGLTLLNPETDEVRGQLR